MMSFTKCMCFVLLMLVMQFSYSNELRLKSIRLSQGGISNQSYDVLSELEQSGSSDEQNDWETYIEITPGHKRLSAKFFFTIDEFEPGNSVDWISIEANTLGAAFDEQRRFYYIRNFQQRRWEKIFDNSNDNSWYWSRNSVDLTENAGQYVSKRGSVVIRLRSNNNLDVVDIDQLVVKVYNGGENVPPGVTPTPIATPRPSLPTLPPTVIPTPTTTQTPIPTAIPSTLPTSIPLPSIEPTPIPLPTSIPLPTAVPVEYINIPLQSSITRVQPMTGIVLWSSDHNNTPFKNRNDVIQLEYTYVRPADIVIGENKYNWAPLERLLDEVASRGKQSILRWYYVYPGERETAVPSYINLIVA